MLHIPTAPFGIAPPPLAPQLLSPFCPIPPACAFAVPRPQMPQPQCVPAAAGAMPLFAQPLLGVTSAFMPPPSLGAAAPFDLWPPPVQPAPLWAMPNGAAPPMQPSPGFTDEVQCFSTDEVLCFSTDGFLPSCPLPPGVALSVRPHSAEAAYSQRLVWARNGAQSKCASLAGEASSPPADVHRAAAAEAPGQAAATLGGSAAPPAPAHGLPPGACVELCGLKTAALNGMRGRLVAVDATTGRWHVLIAGQTKSFKAENLVVVEQAAVGSEAIPCPDSGRRSRSRSRGPAVPI